MRRQRALYAWTKDVERPVAAVRSHLRTALVATGIHGEQLDNALIMASELATNAHRYAPGPYELRLRVAAAEVIVEIHDHGRHLPTPKPREDDLFAPRPEHRGGGTDALLARLREAGRGLLIVKELSDGRCGYRRRPDGKLAWYALPLP